MQQKEEDLLPHLQKQLMLMQNKKEKLLTLIDTLEKTILSTERKIRMSSEEKFKGFSVSDNKKYKNEAIKKYGEVTSFETVDLEAKLMTYPIYLT